MADTMEDIAWEICNMSPYAVHVMRGMSRVQSISHRRQAAMKAMREAGFTYVAIGDYLGGRHPDTIVKGVRAHNRRNGK